jgi:hypothetical protein
MTSNWVFLNDIFPSSSFFGSFLKLEEWGASWEGVTTGDEELTSPNSVNPSIINWQNALTTTTPRNQVIQKPERVRMVL